MIINKENKTDIIKASILTLLYALFFSTIYIGERSVIYISIYCILSVNLSVLIASNIKSKKEVYFKSSLIKKLIVGFILGWIMWPGFGELVGPIIGFYLSSKKKVDATNFSFQKYAWNQFKKNKIALVSLYLLGTLILIARFAPLIANNQPLYAVYKGVTMYPAFEDKKTTVEIKNLQTGEIEKLQYDITDWRKLDLESVIFTPIPYSVDFFDKENNDYVSPNDKQEFTNHKGELIDSPTRFRHHLGTDGKGADLLSGLIHGTRIALKVGLISMGIASFIGIILGAFAGFFGDRDLKMRRVKYYMTLIGLFFGFFYGFGQRKYAISDGFSQSNSEGMIEFTISILIILGITYIFRLSSRLITNKWLSTEISVPIDSMVSRGIEILNSIPRLILIITVTAIMDRSLTIIMVIIGITGWTGIARFTRAEFLRIKSLEYVQASKSLGFSSIRTIFKHALPNALAPVFVSIAFGIASAILIESGLSFLGIGVPDDVVTWGSLLNLGRGNIEAWWLIIFPGIAIFITITIYNMIAEASRDALDPRLKS
ncbi:MAG: ABC transporter permease [Flavobacteriales bacterium]|jgi:peptide/nickel transport system permease protein|nr:ABC transporter permease [Flavobacteriales bacterium]MBT7481572.1 ABC transporter permease [Flavobacteriales bacterium]